MRTFRPLTMLAIATSLLLLTGPLAGGASSPDVVVPGGETVVPEDGALRAARDLVIDGTLLAEGDLLLEAGRDVIVRGAILGAHGAPGEGGSSIRVVAGGTIFISEGGSLAAGAGGHGLPVVVPEGEARGMDGGDGGHLVLQASAVSLEGALLPGNAGRGGDAYGQSAFGGDAGNVGALVVNGRDAVPTSLAANPQLPVTLADLFPMQVASHCGSLGSTGAPAVPLTGANGGDACAHAASGSQGSTGAAGYTDNCSLCGTNNYPACTSWVPVEPAKHNGIKGGGPAGVGNTGGSATALGGKGSDVATAGVNAGNGGNAAATAGNGGKGGTGGQGGGSKHWGVGCQGGTGGNGGVGGIASATSGQQGVNAVDCTKNGASGTASATPGSAGSPGSGGTGGQNSITGNYGPSGSSGGWGVAGTSSTTVPPTVPCVGPGSPALTAAPLVWDCHKLKLTITSIPSPTTAGVISYEIWRSPNGFTWGILATVPYSAPTQVYFDAGLANSTTYHYKVRALSAFGFTPLSSAASAATSACIPVVAGPSIAVPVLNDLLVAPILAAVAGPGIGQATVTILPPPTGPTPTQYKLARSMVSGGQNPLDSINYTSALGETYLDLGPLWPATAYFYQVYATTPSGDTPWSNEVVVMTPVMMGGWTGPTTYSKTTFAGGAAQGIQCSGPTLVDAKKADGAFALGIKFVQGPGSIGGDVNECTTTRATASRDLVSGRNDVSTPTPAECRGTDSMMQLDVDELQDKSVTYHLFRECGIADARQGMVTYREDAWFIVRPGGSADLDASRWWLNPDGSSVTERISGKALQPTLR